jgi:hypothetical protein
MYRLLETDKNPESKQSVINSQIMWDIAEHLELTLSQALDDEGLLIAYQFPVNLSDRENWGGRGDIIANWHGDRVIEVKSLYPGAFKYDIDYPAHQHQGLIYDHYCAEEWGLDSPPLLWYVDRGGQNTPVEQVPTIPWMVTSQLMDYLDGCRSGLPDLPEKMPREIKERSWGKELKCEGSWHCGRCDYTDICKPDTSTSVWARRDDKNQPFQPTNAALSSFDNMLALEKYATDKTIEILGVK